jgi:hypothetical protein
MGIRGLVPGFPELPKALCDGPFVEPLVGPELPRAWANEVPEVLSVTWSIWPRVLTPDNGALASWTLLIEKDMRPLWMYAESSYTYGT